MSLQWSCERHPSCESSRERESQLDWEPYSGERWNRPPVKSPVVLHWVSALMCNFLLVKDPSESC